MLPLQTHCQAGQKHSLNRFRKLLRACNKLIYKKYFFVPKISCQADTRSTKRDIYQAINNINSPRIFMFLITMGQASLNKATLSLRSIIPLSSKKAYTGKRTENRIHSQWVICRCFFWWSLRWFLSPMQHRKL